MRSFKICFVVLGVFALALLPMSTSSESTVGDRIIYPPEFSPLIASRPRPVEISLVPPTKFLKHENAIPDRYIVVLNDDVVATDAPLDVRRARITAIANSHAHAHVGVVSSVYETALKGYSILLPNEAAAIAISRNPQVTWVEEVGRFELADAEAFQSNPPWGLDAIDGTIPIGQVPISGTTNGIYIYNATGAGVRAYVLDSGIRTSHQDFGGRASIAADFIAGSPYLD